MKIKIEYFLYTDGDFSLRDAEEFNCTGKEIILNEGKEDEEYFDYIGKIEFENKDEWKCRMDARSFLQKFLCDGIHVSYTHYYVLEEIYKAIEELIKFVNSKEIGCFEKYLSGNYDYTLFRIIKEN